MIKNRNKITMFRNCGKTDEFQIMTHDNCILFFFYFKIDIFRAKWTLFIIIIIHTLKIFYVPYLKKFNL